MIYTELETEIYDLIRFFSDAQGIPFSPDANMKDELKLTSMDAVDIFTELTEQYGVYLYTDVRGYGTAKLLCQAIWAELQSEQPATEI